MGAGTDRRQRLLVTGGAGFIGSALVRHLLDRSADDVIVADCLTYAGNLQSLASVLDDPRVSFEKIDVCDVDAVDRVFHDYRPDAVLHLAAESHVDRSIDGAVDFVRTNVEGTQRLLDVAVAHWRALDPEDAEGFRFLHVSTDEVYGDLGPDDPKFSEATPYAPSSPYAATKAASDHLVRACHRTHGLPVLITNCSNNYGPCQFPEKLIPRLILRALDGDSLPLYGDGLQVRDWLYVQDHVEALLAVLARGNVGETYNIGGSSERTNLEVAHAVCDALEERAPGRKDGVEHYRDLITFVADRPGHDRRYAVDTSKVEGELGWRPQRTFSTAIAETVQWYLDNEAWWAAVLSGSYRLERLGARSAATS